MAGTELMEICTRLAGYGETPIFLVESAHKNGDGTWSITVIPNDSYWNAKEIKGEK